MCGIAGVFDRRGDDSIQQLETMLECIKHRGPDGFGVYSKNSVQRAKHLNEISFEGKSEFAFGHSRLAIVGGAHGIQPFEGCKKGLAIIHNGEIYNYKSLRAGLEGRHNLETATDSETIVHLLEDNYHGDLGEALAKTLPLLNGVFALVATDGSKVGIARDVMGVKQLYVSVTEDRVMFSSERRALWSVGLRGQGERLAPGHFAVITSDGISTKRFLEPPVAKGGQAGSIADFEVAVQEYGAALRKAVSKRIEDMGRIGIIFSGGIDSVLIAKIAKEEGAEMTCYCAGAEGSGDLAQARFAASKLGFEIKAKVLDTDEVEKRVPKIIQTIEDRNLAQVEVAVPIYAAVEMAQEDDVRVMLTGQAADELFAGYPWYRDVADKDGYERLGRCMVEDLMLLYKETLEREDKITMAHSIELRVPYLDYDVVRVATSIKTELKLPPGDKMGKHVHREVALRTGIPQELAFRAKEAAQHGAGVRGIMEQIALRNGFDAEAVKAAGYSADKSIKERLGSSQRYGSLYSGERKWETPDNVQMYLDALSLKERLTSEDDLAFLGDMLKGRSV